MAGLIYIKPSSNLAILIFIPSPIAWALIPLLILCSNLVLAEPTGIDLIGELNGVVPGKAWKHAYLNEAWYPGETLITSIGQGFTLTTPLQLAQMSMMLANRGERIRPRMLDYVKKPNGEVIANPPVTLASAPPKQSAHRDLIQQATRDVVAEPRGTAHRLNKSPYPIAGKTGTAQVFSLGQMKNIMQAYLKSICVTMPYLLAMHRLTIRKLLYRLFLKIILAQRTLLKKYLQLFIKDQLMRSLLRTGYI